jgi:hypothetical protein
MLNFNCLRIKSSKNFYGSVFVRDSKVQTNVEQVYSSSSMNIIKL